MFWPVNLGMERNIKDIKCMSMEVNWLERQERKGTAGAIVWVNVGFTYQAQNR